MKSKVAAGEHPWIDGWNALIKDPKAQSNFKPRTNPNMGVSRQRAQDDATAAYLNAIRWYVSGDESFAECSMRILDDWSAVVDQVPSGRDQPGLGGIPIGSFALAAEVLRTYPGWPNENQERFKQMLLRYWYPVCHDFLTRHNDAGDDNYWANWDTANILAILAIGVFCDDREKFDEAVEYFKNGKGRGSIMNAVPFVYPGKLGQWQESGRDQAHTMGGMGLLSEMCQVAWNQGIDLFSYADNRLLAGAEYTAQYTLWKGVPYTFYTNSDNANQYYIAQNYHGRLDASHFELLFNHYVVRKGLEAPNVRKLAELRRPEPGEVDVFGYGTLTYTLDGKKSPYPAVSVPPVPRDLRATAGLGRVDLEWSPSGAYNIHGYEVLRATSQSGPYESIHSTTNWTTPLFTDTDVKPGQTYFYKVAALNNSGKSDHSESVSAKPAAGGTLPSGWQAGSTGAEFANAAGGSFRIQGAPGDESFTACEVTGDFTITARLADRNGPVEVAGIMMRESRDDDARYVAMTLGETGGRQARFRSRSEPGGKSATQLGNDYTWMPVWFRLQRVGDIFTAYQSSDGIEWFEVGRSTVPMPEKFLVGFLVKGERHDDKTPEGMFDRVSGEARPPQPPAPPTSLTATRGGNIARLAWENPSGAGWAGIKIEASIAGAPFCEIANLAPDATTFTNTGLNDPLALRYRIRAYNRGGYSPYASEQRPSDSDAPPQ